MIDVVEQINAVHRTVRTGARDPGETRTVTISRAYDTTVDDLWEACTSADRIPRWFLPISGDLRVGGHYQLEGNAGGTIERCEPPTSFAATWEFGGTVTWIEVRLTADGEERTRLELAHTVPVDDHWVEFGPGAVGAGWDLAVMGLSLHIGSGSPVDPAAFAAWSASDEGRRFVALSSSGWRDADVAAGVPIAEADAAAGRTLAAYTDGDGGG